MKQNVRDRLNKRLVDSDMPQLNVEPQRLYRNRTDDNSKCEDRLLNNRMDNGRLYGNGLYDDRLQYNDDRLQYNDDRLQYNDDRLYDDRLYNDHFVLREPIYKRNQTFLGTVTLGNEQLVIVLFAGLIAYGIYAFSKSKD